jgi:hypothetical protein
MQKEGCRRSRIGRRQKLKREARKTSLLDSILSTFVIHLNSSCEIKKDGEQSKQKEMHMTIHTADEAIKIAQDYLNSAFSVPADGIVIAEVRFDGNFFRVFGHARQGSAQSRFGVEVDKEGNVVGWNFARL